MRVKRIAANIGTSDIDKADVFYHDILGLECVMDHGWLQTYGLDSKMTVQISFASEGSKPSILCFDLFPSIATGSKSYLECSFSILNPILTW
jgi:catechol 2,3-dioxygenase-like lactoylglutathione lyase family enzyme